MSTLVWFLAALAATGFVFMLLALCAAGPAEIKRYARILRRQHADRRAAREDERHLRKLAHR